MSLTTQAFDELIKERFALKAELEKIEASKKPLNKRAFEIDCVIQDELKALNVKSHKSQHGIVMKRLEFSVQTPKTREDKEALFAWLKAKDEEVFYSFVGVNSKSLNALYKTERELAIEEGNIDFSIPGLSEPSMRETIALRKK